MKLVCSTAHRNWATGHASCQSEKKFDMCRPASIESREVSVMFEDLVPPAGHDYSALSSAFSLGLPKHCGISSRCGSDRHLCSASAATHPYGFTPK